ncbi:putative protein impact protein [Erysiphe neolycopersici]|uniref:Altered inheritance of mitochondria protein 21 n=1 Tax=Erysiphe neolycopersici TaxID=212602 RepID=A0A420HXT9_9PEZI|nr:putative protein impact protein [Erysiphe neolycopersici]
MPEVSSHPLLAQVQEQNKSAGAFGIDTPKIPSRPIDKSTGRSISPNQDNYARTPLNKAPLCLNINEAENQVSATNSAGLSDSEICHLLSVKLPSIGQEGTEYADVYKTQDENLNKLPINNKHISSSCQSDKLESTYLKSGVESLVTAMAHTDSSKDSVMTNTSEGIGTDRQISDVSKNTQGIPQIGLFVPMYPNAGDVQAPSQSLKANKITGNSSDDHKEESKYDSQKLNGRVQEIPSDAYGRYGHGFVSQDLFDKAYYKKHPELFKKEIGSYGETRPEWAMSSEDLNKIVQDTAGHGTKIGYSIANFGAPSEQIGFKASEEYISRISSPHSQAELGITHLNNSEPRNGNLLIREPSTSSLDLKIEGLHSQNPRQQILVPENSYPPDVIHIDDPVRSSDEYDGAIRLVPSTNRTGHETELEKIEDNHHYEAPILAPDEVAKQPFDRELQPAVFPMSKNVENYREEPIYTPKIINSLLLNKSSAVLEGSTCSSPSIPSEDFTGYEPLFPEEEKDSLKNQTPSNSLEILKRPEISRRFPGQDVWEDTPSSLQYTTTVSAPQLPEEKKTSGPKEIETETPAQAFARRQEEMAEQGVRELDKLLHHNRVQNRSKSDERLEPKTLSEITNHRFPSRDIWEDTPDSLLLQTTVASIQIEKEILNFERDQNLSLSKEDSKSKKTNGIPRNNSYNDDDSDIKNSEHKVPSKSISNAQYNPTRSTSFLESSQSVKQELLANSIKMLKSDSPPLPAQTKVKPQVPARPSRLASRDSSGNCSPACQTSNIEVTGKVKPQAPSRPKGSKIAALQGGFMLDLNKRLQLGPQSSKKELSKDEHLQNETDNAPLLDPRKGRARGPARRAPKKTHLPNPITNKISEDKDLGISTTLTIWSYDPVLEYLNVS